MHTRRAEVRKKNMWNIKRRVHQRQERVFFLNMCVQKHEKGKVVCSSFSVKKKKRQVNLEKERNDYTTLKTRHSHIKKERPAFEE